MPPIGSAQSKKMLVGTWKLVSASNVTDKGIVNNEPYGRNFTGLLTYTPDGRMMALVTWGARKPLSNSRWNLAPTEERAEAFATSYAYAGTFTLKGDKVIHHVEASTNPNAVNTDFVRIITKLQSDRVTLRTTAPFLGTDGAVYAYQELTWDRVK
jgi:hypothetical protein